MSNSIQPMNTLDKYGYRELAELDHYSDEELMTRCLSDFDREIADTDDFDKYAEFIRTTAK